MPRSTEAKFREIVRQMISAGDYPLHSEIVREMGRPKATWQSGLSTAQSRWRLDEIERAGYDVELSRQAKQLIRRK